MAISLSTRQVGEGGWLPCCDLTLVARKKAQILAWQPEQKVAWPPELIGAGWSSHLLSMGRLRTHRVLGHSAGAQPRLVAAWHCPAHEGHSLLPFHLHRPQSESCQRGGKGTPKIPASFFTLQPCPQHVHVQGPQARDLGSPTQVGKGHPRATPDESLQSLSFYVHVMTLSRPCPQARASSQSHSEAPPRSARAALAPRQMRRRSSSTRWPAQGPSNWKTRGRRPPAARRSARQQAWLRTGRASLRIALRRRQTLLLPLPTAGRRCATWRWGMGRLRVRWVGRMLPVERGRRRRRLLRMACARGGRRGCRWIRMGTCPSTFWMHMRTQTGRVSRGALGGWGVVVRSQG